MKPALACLLMILMMPGLSAADTSEKPMMRQLAERVNKLAADGGFTDEDAVQAAIFLLEKLEGPKPNGQKLTTRVESSSPTSIGVMVSYDFGPGFTGYKVEFSRGDVAKGEKYASFVSVTHVPSE